jgi:ABC-2 type transport system permease protein
MNPSPRRFGIVNWRGVWTLYARGVMRFFKFAWESLGGPCVSSLLFLAVFVLALGGSQQTMAGVSVAQFVAPGIVLFSLAHSAFENAAFPVLYDKLEGMIADILMAPLTPLELVTGYVLSAVTNGLVTGAVIVALVAIFVELPISDLGAAVGFAVLSALLFALIGTLVGLWADKWEHYSAAETFLILPLGLLSGTFFTLSSLPEVGQTLLRVNPIFYAIDGFRYGFIGHADVEVAWGAAVLTGLSVLLWALTWRLFSVGYKLKP